MRHLEQAGYSRFQECKEKAQFVAGLWTFHDEPVPVGECPCPDLVDYRRVSV